MQSGTGSTTAPPEDTGSWIHLDIDGTIVTDMERTLIQARTWAPEASLDFWIAEAEYAVLNAAGVALAVDTEGETVECVLLHLGPDGLEAEMGFDVEPDALEQRLGGPWELTRSWDRCEKHLRRQRAGLVPTCAD